MPPSPDLGITAAVYLTPMAKTAHLTLGVAFRPKRRFENVQLYIGEDGEKIEHNQQNCPTGKSLRIFRNRVKPKNQKYSAFAVGQITATTRASCPTKRGARDRHETRGRERWTRM